MSRVRIDNARYVVTVDATDQILRNATVHIEDGVITAITTEDPTEARTEREASTEQEP